MKKFGIITFFLAVGVLCVENGCEAVSQITPSPTDIQGKSIHPSEVKHDDFHARHPEAKATTKAKVGAAGETATMDCIKPSDSGPTFEGPIKALKSTPQSSLNNQCNATYTDCDASCLASKNKSETSKNASLKGKKLKAK